MGIQVVATKGNLIQTKKSLDLAILGYDLLDKKRNVLIKEMMTLLDDVKILRSQITGAYNEAYEALQNANISMGLITNLANTTTVDTGIEIVYRSVMGVEIPKVLYTKQEQTWNYDFERSDSKVDIASAKFTRVKELTVLLAQIENSVFRLASAIRTTQKRANALQNVSIPELQQTAKMISESLEEKEREEFSRQKVIKTRK